MRMRWLDRLSSARGSMVENREVVFEAVLFTLTLTFYDYVLLVVVAETLQRSRSGHERRRRDRQAITIEARIKLSVFKKV
jgi:hypothetical protein